MSAVSSVGLLAAGAAWRLAGLGSAGRRLIDAATGPDQGGRVLAGILLTRAGDRSVPLLGATLGAATDPGLLVEVLASIGTPAARARLDEAARSPRPEVCAAARNALRTLDQIRESEG